MSIGFPSFFGGSQFGFNPFLQQQSFGVNPFLQQQALQQQLLQQQALGFGGGLFGGLGSQLGGLGGFGSPFGAFGGIGLGGNPLGLAGLAGLGGLGASNSFVPVAPVIQALFNQSLNSIPLTSFLGGRLASPAAGTFINADLLLAGAVPTLIQDGLTDPTAFPLIFSGLA